MIDGIRAKLMDNLECSLKKQKVETQLGEQGQLGYVEHGWLRSWFYGDGGSQVADLQQRSQKCFEKSVSWVTVMTWMEEWILVTDKTVGHDSHRDNFMPCTTEIVHGILAEDITGRRYNKWGRKIQLNAWFISQMGRFSTMPTSCCAPPKISWISEVAIEYRSFQTNVG